jgi:hypothetical protein
MRIARLLSLLSVVLFGVALAPLSGMAQSPDCSARFKQLMDVRMTSIKTIQGIGDRNKKKPSLENAKAACGEFGSLVSADENVVSWIESDGSWCGISEEVQGQAKQALENSRKEKAATCKVAVSGGDRQQAGGACNAEFSRLNKARAGTIAQLTKLSAAQKKNATPQRVIQACGLLNTLVSRESNLTGWIKTNTKRCGIPAKIGSQLAGAAANSRKSRSETCSIAQKIKAGGGAAQASNGNASRRFDPTNGGPGVPSSPGGGVRLPNGAL